MPNFDNSLLDPNSNFEEESEQMNYSMIIIYFIRYNL